jgi:hypothetical protein
VGLCVFVVGCRGNIMIFWDVGCVVLFYCLNMCVNCGMWM